ncbi:hypothetical protein CDD83_6097 [Cordyceps sp. RAO-2017]|nr:hypothetical protein CDD83_6097 [Cordyceps sp. RAO-2017]
MGELEAKNKIPLGKLRRGNSDVKQPHRLPAWKVLPAHRGRGRSTVSPQTADASPVLRALQASSLSATASPLCLMLHDAITSALIIFSTSCLSSPDAPDAAPRLCVEAMSASLPCWSTPQTAASKDSDARRRTARPHPAAPAVGSAARGEKLAHLVSKFEVLDATPGPEGTTVSDAHTSALHGDKRSHVRAGLGRAKPPPLPVPTSKSAISLPVTARRTTSIPASACRLPTKYPTLSGAPKSMVAARRMFFEGDLPKGSSGKVHTIPPCCSLISTDASTARRRELTLLSLKSLGRS